MTGTQSTHSFYMNKSGINSEKWKTNERKENTVLLLLPKKTSRLWGTMSQFTAPLLIIFDISENGNMSETHPHSY